METQTFPGNLDALGPIRTFVTHAGQAAGLSHKATYDLCLAVDEIATNIVTYGYEESGLTGDIRIKSEITEERLVISLEDTGKAYDPDAIALPDLDDLSQPLENRPLGGLGILLAKTGVDEFNYTQVDDHHVHEFIVRRNQHG